MNRKSRLKTIRCFSDYHIVGIGAFLPEVSDKEATKYLRFVDGLWKLVLNNRVVDEGTLSRFFVPGGMPLKKPIRMNPSSPLPRLDVHFTSKPRKRFMMTAYLICKVLPLPVKLEIPVEPVVSTGLSDRGTQSGA